MAPLSRRTAIQLTFAAVVVSGIPAPLHTAYADDQGIVPWEKQPLCRSAVRAQVRENQLRVMENLVKDGAVISPQRREAIIEQAINRTMIALEKEYRFID